MRSFLLKVGMLGAPFLLYAGFMVLADPYNYFGVSHLIPDAVKLKISHPVDPPFWKLSAYAKRPSPYVLLGDSRMDSLNAAKVSAVTGEEYRNLAYGGGSLREIISTFWFADEITRLRHVVIGLNFNIYNESYYVDRTKFVKSVQRNPLLYFTNRSVLRVTIYLVYYAITKGDPRIGVPQMNREEFRKEQLGPYTDKFYQRYSYPEKSKKELMEIAARCRQEGIQLDFVIFPTHTDVQQRVEDYHLSQAYQQFKLDLAALSTTYDFDYPNMITRDAKNFKDPYHFDESTGDDIIAEVWQGRLRYARRLDASGGYATPVSP